MSAWLHGCMAASLVFRLHERGPALVREVLLERGWEEYDEERREEEDWNLYWRGSAFRNSDYHNLLPWQRLNHHPKTVGITRKDFLARNLRRMRAAFGPALYAFSPTAFVLPVDFTRFLAEYDRLRLSAGRPVYWICKPVDLSRGRGIFIFEDMKDLIYDGPVIVQRYISDPLLISGYKFDLRIYVCVRSFHPLTVYIHQEGLVRFATEKHDLSSLHNLYAHLTNTSINKFGPFYKTDKGRVGRGCKWTMSRFRHFLHSQDVDQPLLWQRINNIVTLTLLTIAPSVPACPNCVELFGFDILVDAGFKPWLLEVNDSPALTLDCQADVTVKKGLIGDLIDLMSYKLTDGLRERTFQRREERRSNRPSRFTPERFRVKNTKAQRRKSSRPSAQTQTLPLLKTPLRPEKTDPNQRRRRAFTPDDQRLFPPVDSNKIHAAGGRIINTTANETHNDGDPERTLNLILGPRSRPTRPALAPPPADDRSPHVSEVSERDDTETEADVSSPTRDTPRGGPGPGRPAGSWRLPDINRANHRPARVLPEGPPPLRVGDFIRTFPFNGATLRASRQQLDVRAVIQELHKLTARLVASDGTPRGREAEARKDDGGEEDLDSLLWGPKDPPLISQCFRPR